MKRLLSLLAILAIPCLHISAQVSDPTKTTSTAEVEEDPLAQDSVLQEVTADGTFNFKVLGRYARNNTYYSNLVERFERADTTLFPSDFLVLYYGYVYRDEYDGGPMLTPWTDLAKQGKPEEAYDMIIGELKTNPASVRLLYDLYEIAAMCQRPEEELYSIRWRYFNLLACIKYLGNGTQEWPYTVVCVTDEYVFLRTVLDISQVTSQHLVMVKDREYDKLEVVPTEGAPFSGTEVWFDVSYPFVMEMAPGHWAKQLKHEKN